MEKSTKQIFSDMPDFKLVYLYSDQPTTCPTCGARTEILLDLSHTRVMTQIHGCLEANCKLIFVMQTD
jgi:hypothetical protein